MDPKPDVAVIIPVRNGGDRLGRAVQSVLAQTYPVAEIIIAVGPSSDDTDVVASRIALDHPDVRTVPNPTGRTPDGLNLAIEATTAAVVARVDAGAQLPPGYIGQAVQTLLSSGAANVGAVQHTVGSVPFERAVAAATGSAFGVGNAGYRFDAGKPRKVDTAWLGVFWRSALDEVGGYDNHFTRNQDYELNWRLGSVMNGVWLDPALRVDYKPRSTPRQLASQYWQYGWWRAETMRKHPDSVQPRQLAAPALVAGLGVSAALLFTGHRTLGSILPAVYAGGCGVAAAKTPDSSVKEKATTGAVFSILHLSWGAGFLSSVTRLLLRRSDPPSAQR